MSAPRTLRGRGFSLDLVQRNANGDVLGSSLRHCVCSFLGTTYSRENIIIAALAYGVDASVHRHCIFTSPHKAKRELVSLWLGYSMRELWPFASGSALEKLRIKAARGGNIELGGIDLAVAPNVYVEATFEVGTDAAHPTLPPPVSPWQGELHRTFAATPAETSAAALRARVRALEAENAKLRHTAAMAANRDAYIVRGAAVDAYYNGGTRAAQLDRLDAAIEAFPQPAQDYIPEFLREMATWPPVDEERLNPLARLFRPIANAARRLAA